MNKVMLIGRLTQDPEVRHTTTNKTLCQFRLAVNRRYSKQGDEQQTDFFPIVAWEKTSEFCSNYFRKGQQVAVLGRLHNRTWDDAEGKKHYITEIIAEEVSFADSKKSSDLLQTTDASIFQSPVGDFNSQNDAAELPF
ncbi:MAG: Single-stranded DNA-binding protein ssb [Firmicutes bacterium ADurb.Bin419]|nr:MAG: Single-stranded DNA-binding protein ssb [Firmicutes bacterium ADurb.Bin419]